MQLSYDAFLQDGLQADVLRRTGRLRLTFEDLDPLTVTFRAQVKGEGEYWLAWDLPWTYHSTVGTRINYLTVECQCGGVVEDLDRARCYDCGVNWPHWSPSIYWDKKAEQSRREWFHGSLLVAGLNELEAALSATVLEDVMAKLDIVFAASL